MCCSVSDVLLLKVWHIICKIKRTEIALVEPVHFQISAALWLSTCLGGPRIMKQIITRSIKRLKLWPWAATNTENPRIHTCISHIFQEMYLAYTVCVWYLPDVINLICVFYIKSWCSRLNRSNITDYECWFKSI